MLSNRDEILTRSATELVRLIRSREVSALQVVEASLQRVAEVNPQLNAFTAVYDQEAREAARRADAATRRGEPGGRCTAYQLP